MTYNCIWPTTSLGSYNGQAHGPFTSWANLCHTIYRPQTLLKIHTNVDFHAQEKLGENICMNKCKFNPIAKKKWFNVYALPLVAYAGSKFIHLFNKNY